MLKKIKNVFNWIFVLKMRFRLVQTEWWKDLKVVTGASATSSVFQSAVSQNSHTALCQIYALLLNSTYSLQFTFWFSKWWMKFCVCFVDWKCVFNVNFLGIQGQQLILEVSLSALWSRAQVGVVWPIVLQLLLGNYTTQIQSFTKLFVSVLK